MQFILRRMQSSPAGSTFNYTAVSECTSMGKMCFPYVAGGALMAPVMYTFTTYMTLNMSIVNSGSSLDSLIKLINLQISNQIIYLVNSCSLDSKYLNVIYLLFFIKFTRWHSLLFELN